MHKRKEIMEKKCPPKKRTKRRLKILDAPQINSLSDLIDLGNSARIYRNIDCIMLWRITPYLVELNSMIGMESLKESILFQILYFMQGMHKRQSVSGENQEYLHTLLLGPPGSGKTTVAKIIGNLYQTMGVLKVNGPFKQAHRDDFVAGYLGQTAIKTKKLLKSCLGGVLFIDEVYALGPGQEDKDSFSKEAIDTICGFLSEHKNDFCCIAAGYENDIRKCFFGVNSGLESRFQWIHRIEEYTPTELGKIFLQKVQNINWNINISIEELAKIINEEKELFISAGRDIENLVTKCKMFHARRVITLDESHKFILTSEDIHGGIEILKKKLTKNTILEPPAGMYL